MGAPIPEALRVGPFNYRVSTDPAELSVARRAANSGHVGECDVAQLRILVDTDCAPDYNRDTMLHEALEAIWKAANLPPNSGVVDREDAVHRITPWLLGVLRDNPALVAYLTEKDS